jgi:hypothetical protein
MLLVQDVSPEETRERRAESGAESAVVDADGHAVYRGPESAVRDLNAVVGVDLLPGLDDARKQDCGADVSTCELCRSWMLEEVFALPLVLRKFHVDGWSYSRCIVLRK